MSNIYELSAVKKALEERTLEDIDGLIDACRRRLDAAQKIQPFDFGEVLAAQLAVTIFTKRKQQLLN